MTEDEMKKLPCPLYVIAIMAGSADAIANWPDLKTSKLDIAVMCKGTGCPMWRRELTREEAQEGRPAENGYCGLAGKP